MYNKENGTLVITCMENETLTGFELKIECTNLSNLAVLNMLKAITEEILEEVSEQTKNSLTNKN